MMQSSNLEHIINNTAFEIVDKKILGKNEIDKLLGVLTNDGVYAMWVYACDKLELKFKKDKDELRDTKIFKLLEKISILDKFVTKELDYDGLVEKIDKLTKEIEELKNKIKNESISENNKQELKKTIENLESKRNQQLNDYFINLSQNLDNLLFLKNLLERVLVYARYHAKAMED
ncbi:hypothetical protein CE561_11215 [Thermoanaerobacterium thermosaccharolyticum]|uniref:Uncharacterized protein n=3 Tax=Thermoanaerobacterium thermosaccharolyticum TaxID=1517 RepID=A0A231VDM6_THETR|nr:hypothetical protein [Thermoanaerobacterium thermosaccharolyticum]OXT06262.1 hypothetical protein CE561_11215 [Thermoanaerobacterium thermosaccharolyticum]